MQLYFALYRSKATRDLTDKMVVDIMTTSLRNNARDGLTGFLHTDHGHFLQYLEGLHDPLMHRLSVIQRDSRHQNFMIMADGTIDERLFPDWDMGQISHLMPNRDSHEALNSWMRSNATTDPLPLLHGFATHALGNMDFEITSE